MQLVAHALRRIDLGTIVLAFGCAPSPSTTRPAAPPAPIESRAAEECPAMACAYTPCPPGVEPPQGCNAVCGCAGVSLPSAVAQVPAYVPTNEADRRRDVLRAFCEPVFVEQTRDYVGCKECPSFTGSSIHGVSPEAAFLLESDVFGSFSAAGSIEAVLSFSGCEIRSAGMGGVVLAAHRGGAWQVVSYEAGSLGECSRDQESGRTRFLCRNGTAWQGVSAEDVVVRDFARPKSLFLFDLSDNTDSACFPEPHPGVFYKGIIAAVDWLDSNGDGLKDVAATISFASERWQVAPSPARCEKETELMQQRLEARAQRHFLEFISDGAGNFQPSPKTRQVLAAIEAEENAQVAARAKP
jgi:hypothetical protein